MQELLTIPEAAQRAKRPESAIRRAVKAGRLRSRLFGTAYAIEAEDLDTFLGQKPAAVEPKLSAAVEPKPPTAPRPKPQAAAPQAAQAPGRVDLKNQLTSIP